MQYGIWNFFSIYSLKFPYFTSIFKIFSYFLCYSIYSLILLFLYFSVISSFNILILSNTSMFSWSSTVFKYSSLNLLRNFCGCLISFLGFFIFVLYTVFTEVSIAADHLLQFSWSSSDFNSCLTLSSSMFRTFHIIFFCYYFLWPLFFSWCF